MLFVFGSCSAVCSFLCFGVACFLLIRGDFLQLPLVFFFSGRMFCVELIRRIGGSVQVAGFWSEEDGRVPLLVGYGGVAAAHQLRVFFDCRTEHTCQDKNTCWVGRLVAMT